MLNSLQAKANELTPSDKILEFANTLSNPVLLMNLTGEVYAKNNAFEKDSCHISLNSLTSNELSFAVAQAFKSHDFPLLKKYQTYQSTITDKEGRKYTASLHPFLFEDTHIVVIQDNNDENILQKVLDCIPARVFWKDLNSKFLGANHLFLTDCGVSTHTELANLTDHDIFPKSEADSYVMDDRQVMSSGKAKLNIEEPQTRPDGQISWVQTSKVPILDNNNEVIGIMGSYKDITERKIYQQLIETQARQDQLTKLHNRQALQEYFQELEKNQDQKQGGLLFIDLDNFKTVNDTLGHATGDKLLQTVSSRILESAHEKDFIVRLGGDEFSVLFIPNFNNDRERLIQLTNELAESIKQAILEPYAVDSHHIQLGVSIGITYFDSGNINWTNTFNEADMAMYDAKASGKNTIKTFSKKIRENHDRIHKMQKMLGHAIANDELYFNIQPQFNADEKLIGAEALLRWNSKELGEISPVEFIPICEQSGTIHDVGLWVFERAFKLVHFWSEKYNNENIPPLAVNVSIKQFQRSNFLASIEKLLNRYPINTKLIHFELTESLLAEGDVDTIEKIKGLSELGFPLAIDDFGTGYSCLSYLNQLPIDKIKIDKSFTFQIVEDRRQAVLVDTIISMASKLNMDVIAEGVETKPQLDFLLEHGCSEFQGYYFSRPINENDYQALLESKLEKI